MTGTLGNSAALGASDVYTEFINIHSVHQEASRRRGSLPVSFLLADGQVLSWALLAYKQNFILFMENFCF